MAVEPSALPPGASPPPHTLPNAAAQPLSIFIGENWPRASNAGLKGFHAPSVEMEEEEDHSSCALHRQEWFLVVVGFLVLILLLVVFCVWYWRRKRAAKLAKMNSVVSRPLSSSEESPEMPHHTPCTPDAVMPFCVCIPCTTAGSDEAFDADTTMRVPNPLSQSSMNALASVGSVSFAGMTALRSQTTPRYSARLIVVPSWRHGELPDANAAFSGSFLRPLHEMNAADAPLGPMYCSSDARPDSGAGRCDRVQAGCVGVCPAPHLVFLSSDVDCSRPLVSVIVADEEEEGEDYNFGPGQQSLASLSAHLWVDANASELSAAASTDVRRGASPALVGSGSGP